MLALSFRSLINWFLLLRHVLAVVCLAIGARQLLLTRAVQLMEHLEKHGPRYEALEHFQQIGSRSLSEQLADFYMLTLLAPLLALFAGVALSWLIVAERRERRAIPLLVLVIGVLISRLGFYKSDAAYFMTHSLHQLLDLPLEPRLWLIGSFWTAAGLLLLLSTWPFRRPGQLQPTGR